MIYKVRLLTICIPLMMFIQSLSLFASSEIKGIFSNREKEERLLNGDIFKAKITILPLQAAIVSEMRARLLNKPFLDYFQIIDIETIAFSQNNSEVLEIYLTAVLVKSFKLKDFYIWSYKGLNIPFTFENIQPEQNSSKNKTYLIQDQNSYKQNLYIRYIVIALGVFFFLFLTPFFKWRKKRRRVIEINKSKQALFNRWKKNFKNAQLREDFEAIINNEKEWSTFIKMESSFLNEFLFDMKSNIYKKEWDDEYLASVNLLFDKCRNCFGEKWK